MLCTFQILFLIVHLLCIYVCSLELLYHFRCNILDTIFNTLTVSRTWNISCLWFLSTLCTELQGSSRFLILWGRHCNMNLHNMNPGLYYSKTADFFKFSQLDHTNSDITKISGSKIICYWMSFRHAKYIYCLDRKKLMCLQVDIVCKHFIKFSIQINSGNIFNNTNTKPHHQTLSVSVPSTSSPHSLVP